MLRTAHPARMCCAQLACGRSLRFEQGYTSFRYVLCLTSLAEMTALSAGCWGLCERSAPRSSNFSCMSVSSLARSSSSSSSFLGVSLACRAQSEGHPLPPTKTTKAPLAGGLCSKSMKHATAPLPTEEVVRNTYCIITKKTHITH